MSISLYQISEEYREALDTLGDPDQWSEDTDMAQAVADTLEALQGQFLDKAQAVALYARGLQVEAEAVKSEAARLATRAKHLEDREARLREYLRAAMATHGLKELKGCPVPVKVKKNPPRVEILDPAAVPDNLMVAPPPPPPRLDKRAARAWLEEAGGESDWGRIVQDTRLVIGD